VIFAYSTSKEFEEKAPYLLFLTSKEFEEKVPYLLF
jgi:hypothetical protein